jgi:hypothetical protein
MPKTPEQLFWALGGTVKNDRYAWPWLGWNGWRDAGSRLLYFLNHNPDAKWCDFNDSSSNEGIMTAPSEPDKALVENLMNGFDAKLEQLAIEYLEANKGKTSFAMPGSPLEAVKMWSGGFAADQLPFMSDAAIETLAKNSLIVRVFSIPKSDTKGSNEEARCVVDIRDPGCGIPAVTEAWKKTILSLNRSGPTSKKLKLYLSGKHGQGAGGTYQYAQLSLIASRVRGTSTVAFTIVSRQFDNDTVKTPTFKYLTLGGEIMTFELHDEEAFAPGLLMRHIGYKGDMITDKGGAKSMFGLIQRALPTPLYPVRLEHHVMATSHHEHRTHGPGYGYNHHVYGCVNQLIRAAHRTANPPAKTKAQEFRPTHQTQEIIPIGKYDFGGIEGIGMTGVADAGYVTMTAWAIDPRKYDETGTLTEISDRGDVLKNYVNPNKPILFTLDGQTHDEKSLTYITNPDSGAGLWRIGQYMVVQVDCAGLTRDGRFELFNALRDATKKTPLERKIMEEIVYRLKNTPKFQQLQADLAATAQPDKQQDEDWAKGFRDYCKRSDIPLEKIGVKTRGWRWIWEKQLGNVERKKKGPPVAIDPKEPPTFIRWDIKDTTVLPLKMHPGQTYSWTLITDAHPSYFIRTNPAKSKIRITTVGIADLMGDAEFVGGRLICRFRCPDDAEIGSNRLIIATCEGLPPAELPIIVVAKPAKPEPPGGKNKPLREGVKDGTSKEYVMVRRKVKDGDIHNLPFVRPIAVTRHDPVGQWNLLGWDDPDECGLTVRAEQNGVCVFYNAELPKYLELKAEAAKRGGEALYIQTYEYKLVMYAIFHLNNEVVMETNVSDQEQLKQLRTIFTSVAEDLAYEALRETKRLIDIKLDMKTKL